MPLTIDAFLDLTYVVMQLEGARATQRSCTVHLQTAAVTYMSLIDVNTNELIELRRYLTL